MGVANTGSNPGGEGGGNGGGGSCCGHWATVEKVAPEKTINKIPYDLSRLKPNESYSWIEGGQSEYDHEEDSLHAGAPPHRPASGDGKPEIQSAGLEGHLLRAGGGGNCDKEKKARCVKRYDFLGDDRSMVGYFWDSKTCSYEFYHPGNKR